MQAPRRAGPLAARARTAPPAPLADVAPRARDYAQEAKAANTRRAYRADWHDFTAWCEGHGRTALPAAPETVALYLTDLAGRRKTSTLQRRLSSISQAHQLAGHAAHDAPTRHATVRAVWAGIRRAKGTAQAGKAPVLTADVRAMVATLPDTLLGLRDRALLLLGFAGAFRRSELVGLDVGDLEAGRAGLAVTLRRSTTDQEGAGRKLGIPYGANPDTCPARAVQEWLDASALRVGPLFRSVNRHEQVQPGRLSDKAVALVVKRAATGRGATRGATPGTACAPAWPPPRRWRGPASAASWPRPATAASGWCATTSATASSSATTPRRRSPSPRHSDRVADRSAWSPRKTRSHGATLSRSTVRYPSRAATGNCASPRSREA